MELDSEEAHEFYMLTAMFGTKMYTAYLEWCEEAKEFFSDTNAFGNISGVVLYLCCFVAS